MYYEDAVLLMFLQDTWEMRDYREPRGKTLCAQAQNPTRMMARSLVRNLPIRPTELSYLQNNSEKFSQSISEDCHNGS